MDIPSHSECVSWLRELEMPLNIFAHIMQVNKIAVFIAENLREKGVKVDVSLVDRGALVHDIDKHLTLESGGHGIKGKEIVEKKGFPELALFCLTHLFTFPLKNDFPSIEHKIVYYADKRVNNDKIVSLKERFAYLEERYGLKSEAVMEKIREAEKPCTELEKELFEPIELSTDLSELIEKTS